MNGSGHENIHHTELDDLLAYLDGVVQSFEEHPDQATREAVFGMLQAIDALHREGLKRLAAYLEQGGAAQLMGDAAKADRVVYTLLGLYDMLPPDEESMADVEAALARVQPYVESHGGTLKVLDVDGGVVHVEMGGACRGCPGSQMTLQRGVQRALEENFPAFKELVVHEAPPTVGVAGDNGLIGLDEIQTAPSYLQAPAFKTVARMEEVAPGTMKQVQVEDVRTLVANVDGDVYALGDDCPGSMLPLSAGELDGAILTCPWHGERFDVRSGRRLQENDGRRGENAAFYPVAIEDGEIKVAVNVSAHPPLREGSYEG